MVTFSETTLPSFLGHIAFQFLSALFCPLVSFDVYQGQWEIDGPIGERPVEISPYD